MVIDEEAMSISSLATFMQMVPKKALEPLQGPLQFPAFQMMPSFLPPNENDIPIPEIPEYLKGEGTATDFHNKHSITHKDIYGHDLPEDEKEVTSQS
jgi:hypothetical protein